MKTFKIGAKVVLSDVGYKTSALTLYQHKLCEVIRHITNNEPHTHQIQIIDEPHYIICVAPSEIKPYLKIRRVQCPSSQ